MSTFTHAGTSRLNGAVKIRFANDSLRVKVLEKNGHTEVDLLELPEPMSKADAVAYLTKIEFYKNSKGEIDAEVRAAIEDAQDRREVKPKAAKAAKAAKAKPSMESIKARAKPAVPAAVEDLEEAPF